MKLPVKKLRERLGKDDIILSQYNEIIQSQLAKSQFKVKKFIMKAFWLA